MEWIKTCQSFIQKEALMWEKQLNKKSSKENSQEDKEVAAKMTIDQKNLSSKADDHHLKEEALKKSDGNSGTVLSWLK